MMPLLVPGLLAAVLSVNAGVASPASPEPMACARAAAASAVPAAPVPLAPPAAEAPQAPGPEAAAAPEPLPADLQELVNMARALHEALDAAPAPRAPMLDGPDCPLAPWEMVLPAGAPHMRDARTDTVIYVPRGTTLEVNTLAGRIGAQAWSRNQVRVIARHGRHDRLQPRLRNGTLYLTVVNRGGEPAFGEVTVFVPEWMPVRLTSFESRIDVDGVRADVDAGSVQGDVVARQTHGSLQLHSVEGLVRVLDARGQVSASSVNNLVRLERVVGGIDAESVNGDIQLSNVDSPDVDASSVNGSVFFLAPFQPRGRYRLASHNGNLRVGVPAGSDVDVSVHNFRGAFQNDLRLPPRGRGESGRYVFTLGDGGSRLELQSFQGLIQLLRSNEMLQPQPPQAPQAPERRAEENR